MDGLVVIGLWDNRTRDRSLLNDVQFWSRAAKVAHVVKPSVGVFFDLLSRFKITVESITVFVLALVRRVISADFRPSLINSAAIVCLKVLALGVDQ